MLKLLMKSILFKAPKILKCIIMFHLHHLVNFMKEFQTLGTQLKIQISHTSDIATGPGEAVDETHFLGIPHTSEHDRNLAGRLLGRFRRALLRDKDEVDPMLDQSPRRGR